MQIAALNVSCHFLLQHCVQRDQLIGEPRIGRLCSSILAQDKPSEEDGFKQNFR